MLLVFIFTWAPYAVISFFSLYVGSDCACLEHGSVSVNILKVVTLNTVAMSAFLGAIVKIKRPIIMKAII